MIPWVRCMRGLREKSAHSSRLPTGCEPPAGHRATTPRRSRPSGSAVGRRLHPLFSTGSPLNDRLDLVYNRRTCRTKTGRPTPKEAKVMSDCCGAPACELEKLRHRQSRTLWIVLAINAVMFRGRVRSWPGSQAPPPCSATRLDMLGRRARLWLQPYVVARDDGWKAAPAFLRVR